MKILALGDIHGRENWKEIVTNSQFDKIVFAGDYFDSRNYISGKQQMNNFKDLIAYKRANNEKVILLLGNHDYHYLKSATEKYSSYQYYSEKEIQELLEDAIKEELIQLCFAQEKFLFTHAGVTKTWSKDYQIDLMDIENSINSLFKTNPNAFSYNPGIKNDPWGDEICQTPIWVRPASLLEDHIDGFTQIVGHTIQYQLELKGEVIFIDTLGISGQYLEISDGKLKVLGKSEV